MRREQIIKKHINEVFPIKEPGEKEGYPKYWCTKLTPKNRNHSGLIRAKSKEELEDKILAFCLKIADDEKLTVKEAVILALGDDVENPKSKNKTGRRTYQRYLKYLNKNLGDIKISRLSELDIRKALDHIISSKEKLTSKEFNQIITSLNKLANYCAYEHIDVCDIRSIVAIWRSTKLTGHHTFAPKKAKSKDQAFTRSEAAKIVRNALKNPSYKALAVALLCTTGIRVGELLALDIDDIYIEEGFIWVHKEEDTKSYIIEDYTKSNKCREVYLSPEAIAICKACINLRMQDNSDIPFLFLNDNSSDGKCIFVQLIII